MTIVLRTFFIIALALAWTASSQAVEYRYSFQDIVNDGSGNGAIGESQLYLDVRENGADQVIFRFLNTGPLDSSITAIYFEDGLSSLFDGYSGFGYEGGVLYNWMAKPSAPPQGEVLTPAWKKGDTFLRADPIKKGGYSPNGIGPEEWVEMTFFLSSGVSYMNVITQLGTIATPPSEDHFRVAIHVQSFPNDGSDTFVIKPLGVPVPEPLSTGGALGLVSLGIFASRRRFARSR